MKRIRWIALALVLGLMIHIPALAVDTMTGLNTGLQGRTLLILGDSYTAGYHLEDLSQSWNSRMAAEYGMVELNYSANGSTIADGERGFNPMVQRCRDLPSGETPDIVLLQGGSNDSARGVPLGEDGDRDPETFCGAVNLTLEVLREKYPAAEIIGFTPWISDDTENSQGHTQQEYSNAMLRIFAARGLLCYDASDVSESGVAMDSKEFRAKYSMSLTDWFHLNAEGHAMFAPVFARWLEEQVYHLTPADRFYDLAGADASLREAVNGLTGILDGESQHLYAPTRTVSRELLAQVLYRMAGEPSAEYRAILDVDPAAESYPAICWTMEIGLFSDTERFYPAEAVTRQMMATVLCRWYTEYLGREVTTLRSLGAFSDSLLTSAYAKTSLGWALSSGIMEPVDGKLRPMSNVSRGELAVSLYRLRNVD